MSPESNERFISGTILYCYMKRLLTAFSLVALLGSACATPEIKPDISPHEISVDDRSHGEISDRARAWKVLEGAPEGPAKELATYLVDNGDYSLGESGFGMTFYSCPRGADAILQISRRHEHRALFSVDGFFADDYRPGPFLLLGFYDSDADGYFYDFGLKSQTDPDLGDRSWAISSDMEQPLDCLPGGVPNDSSSECRPQEAQTLYVGELTRALDALTGVGGRYGRCD